MSSQKTTYTDHGEVTFTTGTCALCREKRVDNELVTVGVDANEKNCKSSSCQAGEFEIAVEDTICDTCMEQLQDSSSSISTKTRKTVYGEISYDGTECVNCTEKLLEEDAIPVLIEPEYRTEKYPNREWSRDCHSCGGWHGSQRVHFCSHCTETIFEYNTDSVLPPMLYHDISESTAPQIASSFTKRNILYVTLAIIGLAVIGLIAGVSPQVILLSLIVCILYAGMISHRILRHDEDSKD